MEILHFEYLGCTQCRLVANAVVLVPGELECSHSLGLRADIAAILKCLKHLVR